MTKLNLLGAQRVKALTEIMERRFNDAIREVRSNSLTDIEAAKIYAKKIGDDKTILEAETLVNKLKELRPELREVGVSISVELDVKYFNIHSGIRDEIREIRNNGAEEKEAKLKRDLEERKSQLWLVETLEQAQEIVNRPIKY